MRYQAPKRRHDGPSHIDDWLMTYADMITLLLCFFAIFLATSLPSKDGPQKLELAKNVVPSVVSTAQAAEAPPPMVEHAPPVRPAAPRLANATGGPPIDGTIIPPPELFAAPAAKPTTSAPAAASAQAAAPKPPPGDRITTLDMNSAAFFDSGSASLRAAGEAVLRDLAVKLRSDTYRDYQITVEGHTDDAPISTAQFPSNWELSTARASAVAHFLVAQGVEPAKLRAAGYADTEPKLPNRDAYGNPIPENQAANRRVVIKLEKIEKAKSG